ncbi:MAG TPA: DUF2934 domain-containing protein [Ideonella sp.]|nr:DUF2934 domain-containing protein [Ideonella sp.]
MATRPTKSAAKPAVSPAQIIEDGPLVSRVAAEAAAPAKKAAAKTPKAAAVAKAPVKTPAKAAPKPAASPPAVAELDNDLASLLAAPSREELIRQAAHRRYLARGMTEGDPVQDWLEAEAEVDGAIKPGA